MFLELYFQQTVPLNLHLARLLFQSDNKVLRLHRHQYRRQSRRQYLHHKYLRLLLLNRQLDLQLNQFQLLLKQLQNQLRKLQFRLQLVLNHFVA
jgi:hypothetical protein